MSAVTPVTSAGSNSAVVASWGCFSAVSAALSVDELIVLTGA